MKAKNSFRAAVCMILLLIPTLLWARGNPEVGLPKVDRLIKERNYNAAIFELAQYMKDNPEDFDGAQRRVRRIITMREDYNDEAMDLLNVLSNEPTNDKKKLDKIQYLESLEKNPNKSTQDFIAETKAAAQFTYYRAKFDEIMNEGNLLIDQGRYTEAARKFTEGYVFYKNEFDEEMPAELVAAVNSRLRSIETVLLSYESRKPALDLASRNFVAALASQDGTAATGTAASRAQAAPTPLAAAQVSASLAALSAEIEAFSALRNEAAGHGWFFEDTFGTLSKRNAIVTDTSFLPFAQRFTLGRKTSARFEGVLGAFDAHWNSLVDSSLRSLETSLSLAWQEGYDYIGSGSIESALASLERAGRLSSLAAGMPKVARAYTYRADTWGRRDTAGEESRLRAVGQIVEGMKSLARVWDSYYAVVDRMTATATETPSAELLRNGKAVTVRVNASYVSDFQGVARRLDEASRPIAALAAVPPYTSGFETRRDELSALIADRQIGLYRASSSFQERSASLMESDWAGLRDTAALYLAGKAAPEGSPASDEAQTRYYPQEALASFNRVRSGIAADRRVLEALLTAMAAVPQYVLADGEYRANVASVRESLARLNALDASASSAMAEANSRILQANLAKQEADLRYLQAQAALKRSDFQGARDNLQRARERVNRSLEWQESSALRAESDNRLARLGSEITRIENESVVREVRALISSGRNFYYLGNFDQAEQVFTQARTRWGATNVEENSEVNNWLNIVNTALSMKTGRTIPVSAPLYPQMSQILSSANQLYSEGRTLMSQGKRAEAVSVLTSAKQKLQQLQLVYPLNQDAGQLTLKIDQVIDPEAFKGFFSQKVNYIRENYRTERQTAYGDLLDLYEINPSFPGLKRLVDEVEIYLGVRIPPPDPADVRRSAELARSAQRIYDANTRSMFEVALGQLDEAIKLNPDNQQAIALKDRVQTAIGGQSIAVLPYEEERLYTQAVQELQKGNKITASALVEQLMKNPKSRNSSKVIDLKKRIDSQL